MRSVLYFASDLINISPNNEVHHVATTIRLSTQLPRKAHHLMFSVTPGTRAGEYLRRLVDLVDGENTVVRFGQSIVMAFGGNIEGQCSYPASEGPEVEIPSTPNALWFWLRGEDQGELFHRTRHIQHALVPIFRLEKVIDAFQYGDSLDLTGYEDGVDNPVEDEAVNAAIPSGIDKGLNGSSFVVMQQWIHDLDALQANSQSNQDNTIGRRIGDNEEIEDASDSAHVKRAAQEEIEPEAFMLGRSMPWTSGVDSGLVSVAYGRSIAAFASQLNRRVGADDGITDAFFTFTRSISGSYYGYPPMLDEHLDMRAIGLTW